MSKGNVTQNLTSLASGAIERFDPRRATEFAQKSTSEQTRRAYSRVVREFFTEIGNLDPRLVGPVLWDHYRFQKLSAIGQPAPVSRTPGKTGR
jgi:hypothetical protein